MLSTQQTESVKAHVAALKPTLAGKLLFKYLFFRKKLVMENLRRVFGSVLNENEIYKLAASFYSHLFTTIKESILMRFMSQNQIKKKAIVLGEEHLANLVNNEAKGAIIITGHFGNWEFAPIAGILNFKDFREHFYFVRKTQSIKFLEKLFFKRYYDAGLGIIPKKNSLNRVYQVLEDNQIVILVMDQYAKGKEGIKVDFFGQKTGTYRTVAVIARHTGVPVIPARSYRRPDGMHLLEFFPPLPWQHCEDTADEVEVNTRLYNQVLEKMILEYPEQWLWMYKRWKEKV